MTLSTSYLSNASADAYFTTRWPVVTWVNSTEDSKTRALITAGRYIDNLNFSGDMANPAQEHQFPRGTDVLVPQAILDAVCELAYALLDGVDPQFEAENINVLSQGLGEARTTYDRDFAQPHIKAGIPSITAWNLLWPFLRDDELKISRVSSS